MDADVKRCIGALYGGGGADDVKAASSWLQEWQQTDGAYDVAANLIVDKELLASDGDMLTASLYIMAQSLLVQSRKQWRGYAIRAAEGQPTQGAALLEAEARREAELVERAIFIIGRCPTASVVHSKLGHAVAAQLLRSGTSLAATLAAMQGMAKQSLQHTVFVLHVLCHLPEELDRAPFHPVTRANACATMEQAGPLVFGLLEAVLQEPQLAGGPQAAALQCALSWATWIVSARFVMTHSIFPHVLAVGSKEGIMEPSRELLLEVLASPVGPALFPQMTQMLLSYYRREVSAEHQVEWEVTRTWVMATYCEANAECLVAAPAEGQALAQILLQQLSVAPLLVSTATFDAFKKLAATKEAPWLTSCFEELVARMLQRLCSFPPGFPDALARTLPALPIMEKMLAPTDLGQYADLADDLRTFQTRSLQMFQHLAKYLSTRLIVVVHNIFGQHSSWHVGEAAIVAARGAARSASKLDKARLQEFLALLIGGMRESCGTLLLVADYARWMRDFPALQQIGLEVIMGALAGSGTVQQTACAATALAALCRYCGSSMATNLPMVQAILQTALQGAPQLLPQSQETLAGALGQLACSIPSETHIAEVYGVMAEWTASRLSQLLGQSQTTNVHLALLASLGMAREYMQALQKVTLPRGPAIVCSVWDKLQPALEQAMGGVGGDEEVTEGCCAAMEEILSCKSGLMDGRRAAVVPQILAAFCRTSRPCLVGTITCCMAATTSRDHGQFMAVFSPALQSVATQCSTMDALAALLDMVRQYSLCFPGAVWSTWGPEVAALLQMAISGVAYPQRNVRQSALAFLAQVVKTAGPGSPVPMWEQLLDACLVAIGGTFAQSLSRAVSAVLYQLIARGDARTATQRIAEGLMVHHGDAWAHETPAGQEAGAAHAARLMVSVKHERRFQALVADVSRISSRAMTTDVLVAYDFVEAS